VIEEPKFTGDDPEGAQPAGEGAVAPGDAESAGAAAEIAGLPVEPPDEAIRRLEEEVAEVRDKHLRLLADFDNFRKRMLREREELTHRAQAALTVRLLDVLDDLDRVVAAQGGAGAAGPTDPVGQALVLIDKKLRKELEAAGLERVDPVGQPFDPAVAEAVSSLPPPRPELDHTVSATFQVGYRFQGALIRPARVQVYSSEGHH